MIIKQLHYWLQKDVGVIIDGIRWIYNSFEAWVKDQFKWLSVWQFRQAMSLLRELKIVKVIRYRAREWNQTNYYTLDYDRLAEFLGTESSSTEFVKNAEARPAHGEETSPSFLAESTEKSDLCNNTPQSEESLTLDLRTTHKSYNESKNTSSEVTAKQSVAASPENKDIKLVCEAQGKISQTELTGLKQENQANSGFGNKLDGIEANSAKCNIKVVNKEWKSHLDELDQLGVGINPTVFKVVKSNSSEDVEKAISRSEPLRDLLTQS